MKKMISLVSAAVMTASLLLPQTLAFSAAAQEDGDALIDAAYSENALTATGTENTLPYQLRFVPERNFVTAEEVAAGDVVIPASVYITGSTAKTFGSAMVKYNAYHNGEKTGDVYFKDITTGDNAHKNSEKKTYNSSVGSFTTDQVPYCFGSLIGKNNTYTNNSPMFTAREYACDPIFGSTLYSAGSGKITFSASFYTSAEDRKNGKAKTTKDFPCDVTVDADGNGVYSYEYIDQTTFQTVTKTASIPRYNPDTPAAERLPDTCSSVMWVAGTSQLKDGASFLGNASDEFPLFQVNVVIQQGTKPGVYDIKFLDRQSAASGETPCQLTSSRSKEFPTELVGTSIAVGVDSLAVTGTEQDDVKFYTDDNTKAIRATDFATKITADVTYADSTTETGVDITGLVDCYGATPKTLYDKQAQDGFFISENMPLYCNGSLLKWKDTGNNVTQNIMVGKRGDINHDSKVDSQDLFYLMYYIALKGVGSDDAKLYDGKSSNQYMESFLMYLMDFDTWGMTSDAALNSTDMYYLMLYIANKAVGNNVTWNAYVQ